MLTSIMIPADLQIAKQIRACKQKDVITRKELVSILSNRGYYKAQEQVEGLKLCIDELKKNLFKDENPFLYGIMYPMSAIEDFFASQEPVKANYEGRRREVVKTYEGIIQVYESNGWMTLIFGKEEKSSQDGN